MNIGRMYTPPIFIAGCIHPCAEGIGARDEYWEREHPSNLHCKAYRPLIRGYRGTR